MSIGEQTPLQLDCVGGLAGQWDFVYGMLNKFVGFFGPPSVTLSL